MTKLAKAEAALNAHLSLKCDRCAYSVTAFGPVCWELADLMNAHRKAGG